MHPLRDPSHSYDRPDRFHALGPSGRGYPAFEAPTLVAPDGPAAFPSHYSPHSRHSAPRHSSTQGSRKLRQRVKEIPAVTSRSAAHATTHAATPVSSPLLSPTSSPFLPSSPHSPPPSSSRRVKTLDPHTTEPEKKHDATPTTATPTPAKQKKRKIWITKEEILEQKKKTRVYHSCSAPRHNRQQERTQLEIAKLSKRHEVFDGNRTQKYATWGVVGTSVVSTGFTILGLYGPAALWNLMISPLIATFRMKELAGATEDLVEDPKNWVKRSHFCSRAGVSGLTMTSNAQYLLSLTKAAGYGATLAIAHQFFALLSMTMLTTATIRLVYTMKIQHELKEAKTPEQMREVFDRHPLLLEKQIQELFRLGDGETPKELRERIDQLMEISFDETYELIRKKARYEIVLNSMDVATNALFIISIGVGAFAPLMFAASTGCLVLGITSLIAREILALQFSTNLKKDRDQLLDQYLHSLRLKAIIEQESSPSSRRAQRIARASMPRLLRSDRASL